MAISKQEVGARLGVERFLDRPIESAEADILGFRKIAETLIDAIERQPNEHSLTLGLDGPWGSGKSSIFALLREALGNRPATGEIGTVVVPFSPWLITNRTALVAAFFAQISGAIEKAEKRVPRNWWVIRKGASKALANARKGLNRFSKVASIAATAATAIDPTLISAAASGGIGAVEKLTTDGGRSDKTLEALKQELTYSLAKVAEADPSFRILVLIDDLDRLDPADALEVLRLVKAVGDFPATTYLLAYDKSALTEAIQHSAKIDNGDAYLEKIIQFSFKVPPPEPFQLRNWLKAELDEAFPGAIEYGSIQAAAVLDSWAGRLLSTPRDVKRLLFAVRALWPRLENKVDLLDLVWLQLLAQKAADKDRNLYAWVVGYLQGLEAVAIGGRVTGKENEREKLVRILKCLGWKEYDHDKESGSMDFHHLNEILAGVVSTYLGSSQKEWTYQIDDQTLQRYRDGKRLSSPWHWRLYFALDAPSHAVTDDEWDALVQAAAQSTEELSTALGRVLDFRQAQRRDAADQVIGRASHLASDGSLEDAGRWLVAIVRQASALEKQSKRDAVFGFTNLFEFNLKSFARRVFRMLSGPNRAETLRSVFEDKNVICPAAALIRDQYHACQKDSGSQSEKCYLSPSELKDAIKAQISLYESLTPSELRVLTEPYDVLYAWNDIAGSSDGPTKLISGATRRNDDFLETLSALRYVTSSAQNGVPHIPEGFLKHFMDVNAARKRLARLAKNGSEHQSLASELLSLWWGREG